MSEPRRGRPPQRFTVRRIRLIGFHNFVDETIEVSEGGHLFLLGDNGSGKTTVLDAMHMVLTGTLNIELNAAARVAGGRDAGRTLQGVVLRFDQEHGVMNEGGAIAYAALELLDEAEGASLVVGIGIEATTMEADVARWGFLRRGSLDDVPLIESTLEGKRPSSRETLREKLDKTELFARMSDFRRAVAERLFGGNTLYEDVCRFWAMAKAYREIVAKARDFGGLFARLLPAPNHDTFVDILRSARALDELEDALAQLDHQRLYVASLAQLVEEIRSARETIARYRWLTAHRRLAESAAAMEDLRRALASRRLDADRDRAAVEAARGAVAEAGAALAAARAADTQGLAERLQRAQAQLARVRGDMAGAGHAQREQESRTSDAEAALGKATQARGNAWRELVVRARAAVETIRSLENPLPRVDAELSREDARIQDEVASGPLSPIDPAAIEEAEQTQQDADAALRERERTLTTCDMRASRLRGELQGLEARGEESPEITGFAAARAALSSAGLRARPLFEMLEPKGSAPKSGLAAVEALAGDPALGAFVVEEADRDRARAIVLQHAGARLVWRSADDVDLPEWIRDLFASRTDGEALRALATELAQPRALEPLAGPDALGTVEHRGVVQRVHADEPRLLGAEARRRAHDARLRAARQELDGLDRELRTRSLAVADARARCEAATRLQDALRALRGQRLVEAHHALVSARAESDRARQLLVDARTRATQAEGHVTDAERLLEALSARARDAGLEEIERRIAELTSADEAAREGERDAVGRERVARNEVATLEGKEGEAIRLGESLRGELGTRTAELRARLDGALATADEAALEHYARVTQRGDQFKSVEAIDERLRAAETGEAVLCSKIEGDGSSGVRNLQWAGRFGFSWSPVEGRIEDRRGEPLANVLAHIERDIAEQRQVVNDKTRELMDRLVMGALARELQEHVEQLQRTVRDINGLLEPLRFGATRYQFKVTPRADRAELVALVRKMSVLDEESRARFREFVDERLEDIKRLDDDSEVPELLDYRRWFDYRLSMRSARADDTELTRELRALGSGGEQGVPNYLLVLALARLMFDNADARVRPLMFDEAFYGIDAGRRDQLLRFATDLGLQLVVASPDQDGVTPAVRRTTTLFLVKDDQGDVHLAPYHYFNDARVAQRSLLPDRADEPQPSEAMCVVGGNTGPGPSDAS